MSTIILKIYSPFILSLSLLMILKKRFSLKIASTLFFIFKYALSTNILFIWSRLSNLYPNFCTKMLLIYCFLKKLKGKLS